MACDQWTDILTKAKNDGLNHIQTYVFWNLHEPYYDLNGNHTYIINGRANLTGFLQTAQDVGLFVNLRIGPYIAALYLLYRNQATPLFVYIYKTLLYFYQILPIISNRSSITIASNISTVFSLDFIATTVFNNNGACVIPQMSST